MSAARALFVFALTATVANAATLTTIKQEIHKGEVVSISAKEVVLDAGGRNITVPVEQVLSLDLTDKWDEPVKYAEVHLTDSSVLRCAKIEVKGTGDKPDAKTTDVKLTLLQGQGLTVPLTRVRHLLNQAQDDKLRDQWKERVLQEDHGGYDVVGVLNEKAIAPLRATILGATAAGDKLVFALRNEEQKREAAVSGAAGFFFQRKPDADLKSVACKVTDTVRNVLYAHSIVKTDEGYTITLSAGPVLKYGKDKVASLNYNMGKLVYLSKADTMKVVEGTGAVGRYRADRNLDGGPIRMAGTTYETGLALYATTEITYDLKKEDPEGKGFREFKATVGFDDDVGGDDGPVVFKILGDDKELVSLTMTRADKERVKPIVRNITDVKQLKIIVTTTDVFELGKKFTLGDPRVSK